MLTQQQTVLQARQDESSATSVAQPDLHHEMLARVKEIDGDDDKLSAEYQHDIATGAQRSCCGFASGASTCRARTLCHSSGGPVECRQPRLREDARVDWPHQCCSGRSKCKGRHRKFHHTVDAWKTANICNGRRQDETVLLVALGEIRCTNQVLGSKKHSV